MANVFAVFEFRPGTNLTLASWGLASCMISGTMQKSMSLSLMKGGAVVEFHLCCSGSKDGFLLAFSKYLA